MKFKNLSLDGNRFWGYLTAIGVRDGENLYVTNNTFYGVLEKLGGVTYLNVIEVSNVTNARVNGNVINQHPDIGIGAFKTALLQLSDNVVMNCGGIGIRVFGGGFFGDVREVLIENNTVENCGEGLHFGGNNYIQIRRFRAINCSMGLEFDSMGVEVGVVENSTLINTTKSSIYLEHYYDPNVCSLYLKNPTFNLTKVGIRNPSVEACASFNLKVRTYDDLMNTTGSHLRITNTSGAIYL